MGNLRIKQSMGDETSESDNEDFFERNLGQSPNS